MDRRPRAAGSNDTTTPEDRATVRDLLGREPQGTFRVAVRDADGAPMVIENSPLLDDGTPMPTRYWLVDRELNRLIGTIESEGGVTAAEADVDPAELEVAHRRYATERDRHLPSGWDGHRPSGGVGGTRRGVKCLHTHYAWFLAGGDDPVGRWVDARLAQRFPGGGGDPVPVVRHGAPGPTVGGGTQPGGRT